MKFSLLPVGARFEFEGKAYTKTGPIAATSEDGGQRMIPRYAALRPLDGSMPPEAPKPAAILDRAAVRRAFEAFCREEGQVLDEAVEDDGRLQAARASLAASQGRFLDALGLDETKQE